MYIFKVYNSVFLVFSEGYATILLSNFRNTFITSPHKNLYPWAVTPHSPHPRKLATAIYFLPFWICFYWTYHISEIIQCVTFYVWLLSLSIIFSRLICVIACNSTSSLLWLNNISLYKYTTSCLLIHQTDYFNFLTCTQNATVNICVNFCVNMFWFLLYIYVSRSRTAGLYDHFVQLYNWSF